MKIVVACLIIAVGTGRASAEEPPPPVAEYTGPPKSPAEELLTGDPLLSVGQQHRFGAQLQFGLPTGLRLQYAPFRSGHHSYLLEIFAGARSGFWGDEAVFGAGGRAMFTLASDGSKNAWIFAPGVGVSYWQTNDRHRRDGYYYYDWPESDRWFLNLDANMGWLHQISPALAWELGLNFGARIGLAGENRGGQSISGRVSGGTIGVYTGVRW